MEKVLITGATGFVGFHLINQAILAGLEVYAAVRQDSDTSHLKTLSIKYITLNYNSIDDLKSILESHKFDYVIHAAGITKAKDQAEYNKVNAEFSRNLGLAITASNYRIKKFVFISSLAAIGPLKDLTAEIQDDTVPQPVTSYGASKLLAEQYLSEIEGLAMIVIRPTAVYGPREKDIFILFKTISSGLEPHIGSFKQQLSFIYVVDLANLVVRALSSNLVGRTYNISDGNTYDRYALANCIKKSLRNKPLKFHLPVGIVSLLAASMELLYRRSASAPTLNKEKMAELTAINWACSITQISKDLNYQPAYNLEQGVAESIAWYKANNWL